MEDFTSKVQSAVSKATSAAKEMAQETTDMKDQPEQSMGQDEQASFKMAREQMPGDEKLANVSEFDMSPMSHESQVCRVYGRRRLGSPVDVSSSTNKDPHVETRREHGERADGL